MVALFALTLFLSALLLFLVQPMVGKMILPMMGGTPAVWNTCMVFFQAVLLLGYAYSHLTTKWLGPRKQMFLHLPILLLPILLLTLPIGVPEGTRPPTDSNNPVFWLLLNLLTWVGLPFFVVSTSAPLLQRWFSVTGHHAAHDPYFLYAASNIGSMLALFGYPLVLEPTLPVNAQSLTWAGGYALLVALVAVCAVVMWKSSARAEAATAEEDAVAEMADAPAGVGEAAAVSMLSAESTGAEGAGAAATTPVGGAIESAIMPAAARPVTGRRRLWWVFCALVPSSLMLGVTTHVTTNIAPVPLLWVLPLALYLLTFVIVFQRKPLLKHGTMVLATLFLLPPTAILAVEPPLFGVLDVFIHLITFFIATMVCHGELAKDRPSTDHLTEFYFWMSLGGVLGGLINAVAAPLLLTGTAEYPFMLVMVCLIMAGGRIYRCAKALAIDGAMIFVAGGLMVAIIVLVKTQGISPENQLGVFLTVIVPILLCYIGVMHPARFGMVMGIVLILSGAYTSTVGTVIYRSRNFYGTKVIATDGPKGNPDFMHTFYHGTTDHGSQVYLYKPIPPAEDRALDDLRESGTIMAEADRKHRMAKAEARYEDLLERYDRNPQKYIESHRREPRAYFHREGPVGDVFGAFSGRHRKRKIAIVGLASGTMAAYGQPGQHFTFYEIDPEVVRIAVRPEFFTYLRDCQASQVRIVVGDGRLTLAEPYAESSLVMIRGQIVAGGLEGVTIDDPDYDRSLLGDGVDRQYDLIFLDAFSSDAVPTHLLTREAIQLYKSRLEDDGLLIFNISNNYLDLSPLLGNLAAAEGMVATYRRDTDLTDLELASGRYRSQYVVLTRDKKNLRGVLNPNSPKSQWVFVEPDASKPTWTDQFSNIITLFTFKQK